MKLQNKTIWISGASSGIGEALALAYAAQKNTIILSSRSEDKLHEIAKACEAKGGKAHVVPMDLTDKDSMDKALKAVQAITDNIDLLVNNGGISQRSLVSETPINVDRTIFEVNYFGHVYLTKSALTMLRKSGGGQICVISSVVGKFGFPMRSAYAASKHALHGFFETLRIEEIDNHVGVTMICPGRVNTNISLNAINKDGTRHGVMEDSHQGGIPVDKCAKKIIKSLERKRLEVYIGSKEVLMIYIRKYFPRLHILIASKVKAT